MNSWGIYGIVRLNWMGTLMLNVQVDDKRSI